MSVTLIYVLTQSIERMDPELDDIASELACVYDDLAACVEDVKKTFRDPPPNLGEQTDWGELRVWMRDVLRAGMEEYERRREAGEYQYPYEF